MLKKVLSLLLCLTMLSGIAVTAFAEEAEETEPPVEITTITIETVEEFLAFAENCLLDTYSQNLCVELRGDIDLSGRAFAGIPIFCGTFHGNGKAITGLSVTCDGSNLGLFRYLTETAVVTDLHVEGAVAPQGSSGTVGGLAGNNAGQITDCTFTGTVSGGDYVGGLVGNNGVAGIIENCAVSGDVHGNHFVGGIAGSNSGVIRDCENAASINTTPAQNSVDISDITTESLTGTESSDTTTDIGGIAGNSSGVIRGCKNTGDVGYKHMGYNIGGIAGTQMGYITGCENFGSISGRKEVGGIVGQLEPQTALEYTEDTLQILKGQLSQMSGTANRLGANAAANGSQITSGVSGLEQHIQTAGDAIASLIPDDSGSGFLDPDTVTAARNSLNSSIAGMEESISEISLSVGGMISGIAGDIRTLSSQISAMSETLQNAESYLGGTLTDVSDEDTPENLTAKVESCTNYGSVLGDNNVGGIAGAMAMENDLDFLEELQISGELSLNYNGKMRCVVLSCSNSGNVTVKKEKAGGIVGLMPLGLVKNCVNTGAIDGKDAEYAGGIAGESAGYIRACDTRCALSGKRFVGGIAGTAGTVTDCRSMADISASEKRGGIIGYTGETVEITGNVYLAVGRDAGGIDGVSYSGVANSLPREEFLALEGLPDIYGSITLTFRFEDGSLQTARLASGEALREEQIPAIPEKEGYIARWEGLDDLHIEFDREFTAEYTALPTAIGSGDTSVLASGRFRMDAEIHTAPCENTPALKTGETLLECKRITVTGAQVLNSLRILLPEGADNTRLRVLVSTGGSWQEVPHTPEKRYVVMEAAGPDLQVAVIQMGNPIGIYAAAGAAGLLIAAAVIAGVRRRKKKSRSAPEPDADSEQPEG